MDKPKISVITCVYNGEKYLQQCLVSVKNQVFKNYEHIIVYSYSSDATRKIITEYQQDGVKIIETEPTGISNAMNIGINVASGEYIHFLHSDDWYYDSNTLY